MTALMTAPTALDDITLIQSFVTAQLTLASNRHLQIQTVCGSIQLSSRQHGIAASRKGTAPHSPIQVRRSTPYWDLLVQIMAEHGFMQVDGRTDLVTFEHQPIPNGYEMNCTLTRTLWKFWRSAQTSPKSRQKPLHLMVFVKSAWTPVQELACSNGCVFITTLTDEIMLHTDDRVIWLSQTESDLSDQTVFFTSKQEPISAVKVATPQPGSHADRTAEDAVKTLVLRQLTRQIGSVPEHLQNQVRVLSLLQLGELGEELLSYSVPGNLESWLKTKGKRHGTALISTCG